MCTATDFVSTAWSTIPDADFVGEVTVDKDTVALIFSTYNEYTRGKIIRLCREYEVHYIEHKNYTCDVVVFVLEDSTEDYDYE